MWRYRSNGRLGRLAGKELLKSGISRGTVFIFPESLSNNISEMITGLYNIMGPDYTYVGGGSGDNFNSKNSYQFTDEGAEEGALAVALVDGLSIKTCLGHGWKPKMVPMIMNEVHDKRILKSTEEQHGIFTVKKLTHSIHMNSKNMAYPILWAFLIFQVTT